jgi:hypothetical protein
VTTLRPRLARLRPLALLLAFAALLLPLAFARPARAADCTVTNGLDGTPAPASSLRQKLEDTTCSAITIAPGFPVISLTHTLPTITRTVSIQGTGSSSLAIEGDTTFSLLVIDAPGKSVSLRGVRLSQGRAASFYGGNLRITGGTVTIDDVAATLGSAAAGQGGAGVYVGGGTVTMTNVRIASNTAPGSSQYQTGAGLFVDEYYADTDLTITGGTIADNIATSYNGGGIAVVPSGGRTLTVRLADLTISGNQTPGEGGGIYQQGGTLTLTRSLVTGNSAPYGGGMFVTGTTVVTNSTISGNGNGVGAGIQMESGSITLASSTVVNQWLQVGMAQMTLRGNLLAGGTYCGTPFSTTYAFVNGGYNLDSGTSCQFGTANHSQSGIDPQVGALADNGGPTRTHALPPDSPAVNAGGVDCPATDQRGVTRPQGAACDIGAYEYQPPAPSPSPSPSPSPCGQRFGDVPAADPACAAIEALAARGIINGCDGSVVPPLFCPADTTLREQMAALIVRAMPGWADETWPNTFTDQTDDAELMRRVGTLQHYGVAGGYNDCPAQGKVAPCYGPLDPVLRAQAISFVTRAMVAKGYWVKQAIDPNLYGGVLTGTGHEQDASTYWYYTRNKGGVPDYPEGGGFPVDEAAPRAWFARLLWIAIQGTPAAP